MPYPPDGTQRGTKPKDWYYLVGFTASFRIFRKKDERTDTPGFSHGHRQQNDCPRNVL